MSRRFVKLIAQVLVVLAIALVCVALLVPEFRHPRIRNGDLRPSLTAMSLKSIWADFITWYEPSNTKEMNLIRHVRTMDELASQLKAKNTSVEVDRYLHDAWGQEYKLEIKTEGQKTVMRITSSGANGIFEDGEGDDLYLEVILGGETVKGKVKE